MRGSGHVKFNMSIIHPNRDQKPGVQRCVAW